MSLLHAIEESSAILEAAIGKEPLLADMEAVQQGGVVSLEIINLILKSKQILLVIMKMLSKILR